MTGRQCWYVRACKRWCVHGWQILQDYVLPVSVFIVSPKERKRERQREGESYRLREVGIGGEACIFEGSTLIFTQPGYTIRPALMHPTWLDHQYRLFDSLQVPAPALQSCCFYLQSLLFYFFSLYDDGRWYPSQILFDYLNFRLKKILFIQIGAIFIFIIKNCLLIIIKVFE